MYARLMPNEGIHAPLFGRRGTRRAWAISHAPLPGLDLMMMDVQPRLAGRSGGQADRRPRGGDPPRAHRSRRAEKAGRQSVGIIGGNQWLIWENSMIAVSTALSVACEEARKLGRAYVGTEHLLLGVLADPGVAAQILKEVDTNAVRSEIVQLLGRGTDTPDEKRMVYTPSAIKLLDQSVREARRAESAVCEQRAYPSCADAQARGSCGAYPAEARRGSECGA